MPCPEKFMQSMELFRLDSNLLRQINDGYEDLSSKSPKKLKAAYFKRAVDILNENLEPDKLKEILEWNACCKSGAREKASKAFARENAGLSLEEKLPLIKNVPFMGEPVLRPDGTITIAAVSWYENGQYLCSCSNFSRLKRDYSISKNYCYCCAGHFKHHYELMLGVRLETVEIVSSPLDSDGREPCVIGFRIADIIKRKRD